MSLPTPPLALYVHFPWCIRKCPYCDFNSHPLRGELPEHAYVNALLRDLDYELQSVPIPAAAPPLVSIFMGGGTPSLFSAQEIGSLLDGLSRRLAFAPDIEITLEANPGTAEAQRFCGYRAAGINRLSLGIQSLDDAQLRRLGRIHGSAEAVQAFQMARAAGFDNINLDLMYALPQQTPQDAATDLRTLLALAPEHVSYYQLTLEPNTEFALRPPPLPDEDDAWAMHEQGLALLDAAGYTQYEISAHARPGKPSRHNVNYWMFGDYLGIGAGAHGKRTLADGRILRRARHKHPKTYLQHAGTVAAIQEERTVAPTDLPFEFLMNALRLRDGFPIAEFTARTGLAWDERIHGLREARARGLLEETPERVRASPLGWRHLNAVLRLFLDA
ncbi:oxygen-independent coproporphyrinogen-3 oxidase [Fontimonas thermophila]|uniref:Heme chaperone HemW n=1 Tax=Fontimonas thermophila TaxID=1076937 RepID=A0A1I2H1Z9_9GAMM|nr:radical SAM family heme chaperone HemW [Fontimonas thermophila]SFF23420.1 oxygen-independent coproporphyrinogen-3 oxidase [Fontimonas thermophila]